MDNLSHSVAGLAIGELVARSLAPEADPARQRQRRRLLLAAGWAASNFPDLDLLLTPLMPDPLGYLLHHRGHTHTLLYAIAQALLLVALLWALWPSARTVLRDSVHARAGLLIAVGAGFLLHLSMDYLNSYGIHPFHPFDSRWLYGDMVFIIEPLFWIAFGVPLAMMAGPAALRALLLGLLLAAPVFFTYRAFLHWSSAVALAALAITLALLQRRAGPDGRQALFGALGAALVFVMLQGAASVHGKRVVAAHMQQRDAGATVLDAALTAFPTNPFCWSFVSVERNKGAGIFRLRRGFVSLAPDFLPVTACPAGFAIPGHDAQATPALAVKWHAEASLEQLRRLRDNNCHVDAWLRFARAPALGDTEATDVRFGIDPARNFATIRFAQLRAQPCPQRVPAWGYPRADLLGMDIRPWQQGKRPAE